MSFHPELHQEIDHLSPHELLLNNIETERFELLPIDNILIDASLVDPEHVNGLKGSIKKKRGQISPITVRARLAEGTIVYDIIDGFHRVNALKIIEADAGEKVLIKATVIYGCSDEELFDLRVLAVSSVASIKFTRMAEWMQKSFLNAKWENHDLWTLIQNGGFSLYQAFSLTDQNSSGKIIGLSEAEAVEVKDWVRTKAAYWDKSIGTLTAELRVVEQSSPVLVKDVRKGGGGGHDGSGPLTFARLKAISDGFPNQHALQEQLAEVVINNNVTAVNIPPLVDAMKSALTTSEGTDEDRQARVEQVLRHYKRYIGHTDEKPREIPRSPKLEKNHHSLDEAQVLTLLQSILDSVLDEVANETDEEEKARVQTKISELRAWLGIDTETTPDAKTVKPNLKGVALIDLNVPLFLLDKMGQESTFDFQANTITLPDTSVVTLRAQESILLALKVIYGSELTKEMIRVELYGLEMAQNEKLDSLVKIMQRQLRAN